MTVGNKIGFVEGHGNSNSKKFYQFTDNSVSASGKYSYRLKQIDIDGQYEYSQTIEIEVGIPKNLKLLKIILIHLIQQQLYHIRFRKGVM
jgi:hypothetical protein